jgi:endonuclease/exonuclease/phosphatase (EEP) superfamily protein YafD
MKSSYIIRAKQSEKIQEEISKSPYPIIVAGDFNDTPVSYSYRKISKGLKDAFVTSGKGMGPTYREFIFPLRIDYLLHHPSISSSGFTTHDVRFSDHRPIEASFWLNSSEGE